VNLIPCLYNSYHFDVNINIIKIHIYINTNTMRIINTAGMVLERFTPTYIISLEYLFLKSKFFKSNYFYFSTPCDFCEISNVFTVRKFSSNRIFAKKYIYYQYRKNIVEYIQTVSSNVSFRHRIFVRGTVTIRVSVQKACWALAAL